MRRLLEKVLPRIPVLSPGEIVPGTPLSRSAEIRLGDLPHLSHVQKALK
jgi:hypothetical protein